MHEVVCESSVVGGRDKTKMESLKTERERERERIEVCLLCTRARWRHCRLHTWAEPSSPPFCLHLTAVRRLVNLQIIHCTVPTPTPPPPPPQMCTMAVLIEMSLQIHWKSNILEFRKGRTTNYVPYFRLLINHAFLHHIPNTKRWMFCL